MRAGPSKRGPKAVFSFESHYDSKRDEQVMTTETPESVLTLPSPFKSDMERRGAEKMR